MKIHRRLLAFTTFVLACSALPASAADRMRAGHWVGSAVAGARTIPTSSCVSQSDADAINGDAKTVQAYLETVIPPTICKLSDIKVQDSKITYTAACGVQAEKVVTTSYHGDSFEGSDNTGTKTEGKLVGPCK